MKTIYYVSKLENNREWVLGQFDGAIEWTAADGVMAEWRIESDDRDEMEELAAVHGGSVESFERAW